MATTKKRMDEAAKKVAESSAGKSEATVAVTEQPKADATPKKKTLATSRDEPAKVYRIVLIEGATLERQGHNFVAGRPLVTADEKLYEALKSNGRFRCDVVRGGSE
jgi:hypothetical protein